MNDRAGELLFAHAPKTVDLDVVVLVRIKNRDGPVLAGKTVAHASRNARGERIAKAREDQCDLLAGARFGLRSWRVGSAVILFIQESQGLGRYERAAPAVGQQDAFARERL